MKTPHEIKAFVKHCKYIARELSELRAKRAKKERVEQLEMDKYLTGIARVKLEVERKEYERLKAKFG